MKALAIAMMLVAVPAVAEVTDWRRLVSDTDRARLRDMRATWLRVSPTVQRSAVFDPEAALPDVTPPFGRYRCRLYRFNGAAPVVGAWLPCRIEADKSLRRFVMEGGEQRPAGHFYTDGGQRMVFLGSLVIGTERRTLNYGRDRLRDLAGVVERVGPDRWRLVMPMPRFGGTIDLIELVPV